MYGQKLRTAVSQSFLICAPSSAHQNASGEEYNVHVDHDRHQKFVQRRTGSEVIQGANIRSVVYIL